MARNRTRSFCSVVSATRTHGTLGTCFAGFPARASNQIRPRVLIVFSFISFVLSTKLAHLTGPQLIGNIDAGEALEIIIHLFGAMPGRNPAAKSFVNACFD